LQRLKENLWRYVFQTVLRRGKDHAIPDALSRAPVSDPKPEDLLDSGLVAQARIAVFNIVPAMETDEDVGPSHLPDPLLGDLRAAASSDADYSALLTAIQDGFPSRQEDLPITIRGFWKIRNDLWTDDGLVLFNSRIVIPSSKHVETLLKLHSAHQGIERTKRRARQLVYWPRLVKCTRSGLVKCVRKRCPAFNGSVSCLIPVPLGCLKMSPSTFSAMPATII
jgi:hypothetical protein